MTQKDKQIRHTELLNGIARNLSDFSDPFNTGFLAHNQIDAEEHYDLCQLVSQIIRGYVRLPAEFQTLIQACSECGIDMIDDFIQVAINIHMSKRIKDAMESLDRTNLDMESKMGVKDG